MAEGRFEEDRGLGHSKLGLGLFLVSMALAIIKTVTDDPTKSHARFCRIWSSSQPRVLWFAHWCVAVDVLYGTWQGNQT